MFETSQEQQKVSADIWRQQALWIVKLGFLGMCEASRSEAVQGQLSIPGSTHGVAEAGISCFCPAQLHR